jgi:hypothetical protein
LNPGSLALETVSQHSPGAYESLEGLRPDFFTLPRRQTQTGKANCSRSHGLVVYRLELEHTSLFFIFYFLILFICAYNVWVISPPFPPPPPLILPHPLPPTPSLPGRNYFALISIFVEESISNNRKDQGFLLVEIRIDIQGADSH